ncbi:MAG: GIY-YIG nuclease family protein [Gammaproteobacteria bacterium]|nr:GIY-YIG nuclease family protein [Gammaproteobacteria bacterium]
MSEWFVYMVRCSDDSLYTGIARDVTRRVNEHNNSNTLGAKYTRNRRPVELVYHESVESRSEASKREYALRKLGKAGKESLLRSS